MFEMFCRRMCNLQNHPIVHGQRWKVMVISNVMYLKRNEMNISYVSRGGGKVKLMALYVIYKSKTYLEPTVIVFCRYSSLGHLEEVV